MTEEMSLEFECRECGGNEFGYQKYAKCITPAKLQKNNNIKYGQSVFDEDDYLIAENTFVCVSCGGYVEHCGFRMESEKDLLGYLTVDPEVRDKEQSEYDECLKAQADDQEEQASS